jgi:hypothetical protein
MHAACYHGKLDIVKYLAEVCGCDPNVANFNGWNALTFAVMGFTHNHRRAESSDDATTDGIDVTEYLLYCTEVDVWAADQSGN